MLTRTKDLVQQFVGDRHTPGAVMLVGCKGRTFGPYAMGYTSFFPNPRPVTEDVIYDLASVTKVVATTTAVLLLLEDGALSLNDTLGCFYSGVPADKAETPIWQLMTHTSGIPQKEFFRELKSPSEVEEYILNTELAFSPGTDVLYSCLNFVLLSKIIEECASMPFDVFVKKHILEPLGMENTYHNPPAELHDRVAYTEWCPMERRFVCGQVHDENSRFLGGVSGNAGLFATAGDLGIFASMLLQEGAHNNRQFLHPTSVGLLNTNYTPQLSESRGIGWLMKGKGFCSGGDLISSRAFGHTGFTGTSLWIDAELEAYFILLTNRVHPSRTNEGLIRFRPKFHNTAIAELGEVLGG